MREVLIIINFKIVKVFFDLIRFQIFKLFRERLMSVNELSDFLGKDRIIVYRYIKVLEVEGFVEEIDMEGNERIYVRMVRMFLIKVEFDESIEEFRQFYLQVEVERIVMIFEKSGFQIKDREVFKVFIKEVFNIIEFCFQLVIKRILDVNIELMEIELFYFFNMFVFFQSCEFCDYVKRVKDFILF